MLLIKSNDAESQDLGEITDSFHLIRADGDRRTLHECDLNCEGFERIETASNQQRRSRSFSIQILAIKIEFGGIEFQSVGPCISINRDTDALMEYSEASSKEINHP
jgi:hypothetical protein